MELLTHDPIATGPARGLSLVGVGAMFALAVLDLAAAYCAVRYLRTGHWGWWSAGAAGMVVLFAVYAASLEYAELATVTLGWIVILQVGVVVMDRVANGIVLPPAKWLAIAAILLLMTYLLLAPNRVR
ncbi:hypothetical protein [Cryptosporangium arvum]|uniref:Uncharacterized protein n=1 Tax=Cryptosporangium arvum DSM 44712 TaxID=927661 RepID=A0A011A021_9ACTN|nr:hypothetical protein [Cryptosporangium arvum]EXG82817.1 hypothetical protein CryarDRAFT_4018 [Cryptosporangium arvum DSM 44712]